MYYVWKDNWLRFFYDRKVVVIPESKELEKSMAAGKAMLKQAMSQYNGNGYGYCYYNHSHYTDSLPVSASPSLLPLTSLIPYSLELLLPLLFLWWFGVC